MKIAYIPYQYDGNITYDKKNILLYGKLSKKKIFKFNKKQKYDYLILPPSYDVTDLEIFKNRNEKIIGQLIDNYLEEKNFVKNFFRGVIKYFLSQQKKISFNYKEDLRNFIKRLDIVLCSSNTQLEIIKKINNNAFIIFEGNMLFFKNKKKNYKKKLIFKIAWEGRAESIKVFKNFYNIFAKILKKRPNVELHLFSDYYYSSFNGKFFKFKTFNLIKKYFKDLFSENTVFKKTFVYFHQWHPFYTPNNICNADLAIIPEYVNNKFDYGKSANKIYLFGRMGIPLLIGKYKSYVDFCKNNKLNILCKSEKDWTNKILKYIDNQRLREKSAKRLRNICNKLYSNKKFVEQYNKIFKYY